MTDMTAFGPQGPNYATTRPPHDPKASAGIDTWFKNCSAAGAKDGTFATADFFNVLIGNIRYLVRNAGVTLDDYDDTMLWQAIRALSGASQILTAPQTYYVNFATGSDNNDGLTAATAFQTISKAALQIANYNLNGYNITVNVADGNYGNFIAPKMSGSGNVNWVGNSISPANVVVTGVNASAIAAYGISHNFVGMKTQASGSGVPSGVTCAYNGYCTVKNFEFGSCVGPQLFAAYGSSIRLDGTTIKISGGSTGNSVASGCFAYATNSSTIDVVNLSAPPALTLVGTPAYGTAFIFGSALSTIQLIFASITGTATGQRYLGNTNAIINSGGGGASYYPGNVAGAVSTGAQYV